MKTFPDDIELIKKLRKGDVESFDLIYEKYSGKLYSFGLKYLRSIEETEELVQSVFLKVWENHKILKIDLSFKSYIFSITYNDICQIFRRRKYNQEYLRSVIYDNHVSSSETENRIDHKSVLNHVKRIIGNLPERQRVIFIKSRFEEKSTKEIAEEVGLSCGTVDNYLSEALKYVRRQLQIERSFLLLLFFLI
jgi:RNA polymerase sigma-70 factor (family 1)